METIEKIGLKNVGMSIGVLPFYWQIDIERSASDVRVWFGPFYIGIGFYKR